MGVSQSLTLTELSTNAANNTSQVRLVWTSTQTGDSWNGYTKTGNYTINGSVYSVSYTLPKNSTVTIADSTFTIYHNSDGSGSVSASSWMDTGISAGVVQKSAYLTLTNISRGSASSLSCSSAYIGEAAVITINRASSSFRHTLTYSFNGLTGTIATKTSSTSINWTIPTDFYAKIPNSQSGQGTITCITYNGSYQVGTQTCSFYAKCNESQCCPTMNDSAYDSNSTTVALTGNNQKFIRYYSNVTAKTNAAARNSATLTSQKITCGSQSINSGEGTINGVDSDTITFSATDSRGFTNKINVKHTLIEYLKLTCDIKATSVTETGNLTIYIDGNYWNGNFGAANNTLSVAYRYKVDNGSYTNWQPISATVSNGTYSVSANLTGFNNEKTYLFQARAIDKLATITSPEIIAKSIPIFDWGKNDFNFNVKVNVEDDFNVNGNLTVNDNNFLDLVYPVGSIYMSVNSTNPGTLFGGSWSRIQDTFLLAAGSSYAAGSTGGEATHTLTVDEMPAHIHNASTNRAGSHSHSFDGRSSNGKYGPSAESFASSDDARTLYTSSAGAHEHIVTINSSGGGDAHNNMPPYLAVFVWERVS